MARYSKFKIALCALVLGFSINSPAMADDVNYTGNDPNPYPLQNTPSWFGNAPNSLFPGDTTNPAASGNNVTVNYTNLTNPYYVFGGLSNTGDAGGDQITINNGFIQYAVFGSYIAANTTGNASDDAVTINGGSVGNDVYGAFLAAGTTGNANENSVTINQTSDTIDTNIGASVYGAYLDKGATGDAIKNKVEITGGNIGLNGDEESGNVYGAYLATGAKGSANNNTVTINQTNNTIDTNIGGSVYGGHLAKDVIGDANQNKVTITGNATVTDSVYGAMGDHQKADENIVNISKNVTVNGSVYGADGDMGGASNNTVTIDISNQGNIGGSVYGGVAEDGATGDVSSNKVTITNGSIGENVAGAYLGKGASGDATGNIVKVAGGGIGVDVNSKQNGHVYGAYLGDGATGNANENTVEVSGGNVNKNVYGARVSKGASGNADNNSVIISGGLIGDTDNRYWNGEVFGVFLDKNTTGNANGNTVTISGSDTKILGKVFGAWLNESTKGNATGNTVNISGGTIGDPEHRKWSGDVYGAYLATGATGNAENNTINITGGIIKRNITGAYLEGDSSGNATGNTVNLGGGIIEGNVNGAALNKTAQGLAQYNTVRIWGAPNLEKASLYGNNQNSWATDGNTLIVNDYRGTSVNTVANFQNYEFVIGNNVTETNAALKVTNQVNLEGATVKITGVTTPLNTNSELMLIDNTNKGELSSSTSELVAVNFATTYQFEYYYKGDALMTRIRSANTNPQTKTFSEGFLAGALFLNQKNELVSKWGLPAIGEAIAEHPNARVVPFAVMQGGRSNYKSGSSINVKGFSGVAGLAVGFSNNLSVGAFFEAGWGNYNTRNSFNNFPNVKGKGDTKYYGGGIMARQDKIWQGLYAQGYFSLGRSEVDFRTNDIINAAGQRATYDSSSTYYSAHAGLGYLLDLAENAKADIYARYLWNRTGRDNVTVGNDPVKFKAVDSHRLQVGARVNYDLSPWVSPYAGAAWEYEFGGKAKARIYNMNIDAPSVRGATGIGELGLTLKMTDMETPLYLEAGVQGYVGKREGVTGTLRLNMAF